MSTKTHAHRCALVRKEFTQCWERKWQKAREKTILKMICPGFLLILVLFSCFFMGFFRDNKPLQPLIILCSESLCACVRPCVYVCVCVSNYTANDVHLI